jgi:hypothetical protein
MGIGPLSPQDTDQFRLRGEPQALEEVRQIVKEYAKEGDGCQDAHCDGRVSKWCNAGEKLNHFRIVSYHESQRRAWKTSAAGRARIRLRRQTRGMKKSPGCFQPGLFIFTN